MHHIIISPAINMIDLKLTGFLERSDVGAIEQRVRAAFAQQKLKPDYFLLADIGGCSIQSQDILALFTKLVGSMPPARRIAVITGSAMVNLQMARVISRPYLRVVGDRQAALAWLVRGEEPRQAA